MTAKISRRISKEYQVPRIDTALLWIACIFVMGYFFKAPALAAESVKKSLTVCAAGLIPSLFPFIVLVGIINRSGLSLYISSLIGRPIGKLLGIRKEAVYALLLGFVGGFPIGAICVRELYESGALPKKEAEELIGAANNASPAFCIATLGIAMYNNAGFGIRLYLCQLTAALILCCICRKKLESDTLTKITHTAPPLSDILTESVTQGGLTMLKICSFAVFFAVIGDAACRVSVYTAGEYSAALCAAFFELTLAGQRLCAYSGATSAAICAFAVGWSGLSVHMQTASVLSGSGLSMNHYFKRKLAQGLLSALLMGITYSIGFGS